MREIHSRIARRRAAAVSFTALCVAAGTLAGCGDAGATITRLTVGSPGPEPYTLMSGTDQMKVANRPQAGGTREGDSPGLYGGTRHAASCDQNKLIAFLQANPAKAKAWAGVQGIPVTDIPRYVSRLTPVLLRTDTLVTNHGWDGGRATSGPAVLQAGMGVLVNGYGVPTVKCNCGNPLTQPEKKISAGKASYRGRSWPGFEKAKVTKVRPRDSRKGTIETFVLVDPGATMGFERPRATTGPVDGPPTDLPETELAVTSGEPSPTDSGGASPETDAPTGEPGTPGPDLSTGPTGPTESTGPTEPTDPGPTGGEPSPEVSGDPNYGGTGIDPGASEPSPGGPDVPISMEPSREPEAPATW
ncbi:hypothetical protein AGRA3207_001170 [Actinomadura graeca]|uniref:DUF6777 domain-containing protein n=1 Tax=Actinomadura graeca TaxID=2750812 RepID=A0ABX8R7I5_9ACTN|nr:DUF6777 domain-containing protein [Actinomadura graeca]QXJ27040.1 hypothetical protein AGRA3207_001170 [Actinomadura graeca]